jgi:hypothetical protein
MGGEEHRAPPLRRQRLLRVAGAFGDHLQICGCRAIGLAAPLFPILQCRERDAIDAGEFLLGHPQFSADGAHIGHFDDMNSDTAGLTLGMFAGLRLSISSLLNLFMLSSSTPISRFQARHKPLDRSPRIRREVIAPSLRVDHQQVKRHCRIMVEINDADPASLAVALATPPDFANATASRDQMADLRVSR